MRTLILDLSMLSDGLRSFVLEGVQKALFNLGFFWAGEEGNPVPKYLREAKYLFVGSKYFKTNQLSYAEDSSPEYAVLSAQQDGALTFPADKQLVAFLEEAKQLVQEIKTICWKELKSKRGVYRLADKSRPIYFIVIKNPLEGEDCVLYFNTKTNELEVAMEPLWEDCRFVCLSTNFRFSVSFA